MQLAVLETATIGWVLVILAVICLVVGIAGGVVAVVREAFEKKDKEGIAATAIVVPGLGEVIKEAAKKGA